MFYTWTTSEKYTKKTGLPRSSRTNRVHPVPLSVPRCNCTLATLKTKRRWDGMGYVPTIPRKHLWISKTIDKHMPRRYHNAIECLSKQSTEVCAQFVWMLPPKRETCDTRYDTGGKWMNFTAGTTSKKTNGWQWRMKYREYPGVKNAQSCSNCEYIHSYSNPSRIL